MIFDTTSAETLDQRLDRPIALPLVKQLIFAILALGSGWIGAKLGWRRFLEYRWAFLMGVTFLLLLVLLPGIGKSVNGSKRWIQIGFLSLQPSEFFKYAVICWFGGEFARLCGQLKSFFSYIRLLNPLIPGLFLILMEPNNGTVFVLVILVLALSFLAGVPTRYWGIPLLVATLIGGFALALLPYAQRRIETYLHPEHDLKGKGHQPYQARIAAGSGGVLGRGPGKSLQKLSYLPEAQNDYIVAIFAEEWGFMGMTLLLATYLTFFIAALSLLVGLENRAPFLLGGGILFLISFQTFMNLGVVSGLLPPTGLNLPFFSQGGSSLVANAFGVGILYDIGRAQ
jgi:cell division protein FtsW